VIAPILDRPVFERLLFAQCWEDPRLDAAALRVEPGQTVLSVTSGGCNTLFVGWPAVENRLGWQSGGLSHFYRHIWLNEAKAPIKKA